MGFTKKRLMSLLVKFRRPKPKPEANECDTCGQVCTKLTDGMCDWCAKFYKANK